MVFLQQGPRGAGTLGLSLGLAIVCSFVFLSGASAQTMNLGTAPSLSGVTSILTQVPVVNDAEVASSCGTADPDLINDMVGYLQDRGFPVVRPLDAKPLILGEARVELVPEVVSFNNQGLDCVSWVALTAQSQKTLVILPVAQPRAVTITYWRRGLLVSSNVATHGRVVAETLYSLGKKFGDRYKSDQPPALPDLRPPSKKP